MPELSEVSPYVRGVLADNHFEPVQVLRYGPRFAVCVVRYGDREGLFKLVLPMSERKKLSPSDYIWTKYDSQNLLEDRLVKEALFLQFFSHVLGQDGFEPEIIALSETAPVWSLRTFISGRTMSAWGSDFVFSPRFFETFEPEAVVNFFERLHALSPVLPQTLTTLCKSYKSTLTNEGRFANTLERSAEIAAFRPYTKRLEQAYATFKPRYADYEPVITHYEPYPPHIFASRGRMGLIDWENVGWGHKLQDLSVLWMRCFTQPQWQQHYTTLLREAGYFEGNGQLFWETELLIQAFANHTYFASGGPIGTPEYDAAGIAFFEATIHNIMKTSDYFGQ